MAKQATPKKHHNNPNSEANLTLHFWRRLREGGFILVCSIAIFIFIALFTYNKADPAWSHVGTNEIAANAAGKTGALISDILFSLFGYVAYLFPLSLILIAIYVYQDPKSSESKTSKNSNTSMSMWVLRIAGGAVALAAACGLTSIHIALDYQQMPMSNGGIIGQSVRDYMINYLNLSGTTIILVSLWLAGVTFFSGLSWLQLIEQVGKYTLKSAKKLKNPMLYSGAIVAGKIKALAYIQKLTEYKNNLINKIEEFKAKSNSYVSKRRSGNISIYDESANLFSNQNIDFDKLATASEASIGEIDLEQEYDSEQEDNIKSEDEQQASAKPINKSKLFDLLKKVKLSQSAKDKINQKNNGSEKQTDPNMAKMEPKASPAGTSHDQDKQSSKSRAFSFTKKFSLPSLGLLDTQKSKQKVGFSEEHLSELSDLVELRLKEFGVDVKVVAVLPGPVITRFELALAPGIKASKISNLASDLARSLLVVSVRVVEVIPGKPVVGLEIPNLERETVQLKDILTHRTYQDASSPLTLGLGKDISGKPIVADLAKMPHLLVAGTTGSGKSVGVNAMLLSILYKAQPHQVRLILIDPKMLELAIYDDIPHLLTPVVTDMKDAANALRWCVNEMERRYKLMAALGVRNLAGFNAKVKHAIQKNRPILDPLQKPENLQGSGQEAEYLDPLPFIVVVVDEFADLMMVAGKKVEELIARIAQKARAAGIHLILATQRPSVDVITGLIKANIPTRIAFQVSSKIDSRTILDGSGAEQLLGQGDMLFLPPGRGISERVHGAFVSDEEVHRITDELRKSGSPEYITQVTESAPVGNINQDDELDELFDHAVAVITDAGKVTASMIQRRLKIGYNRAARLIDQMEAQGIISPIQSNGQREVLAPPTSDIA